jgi:hypothetical protein
VTSPHARGQAPVTPHQYRSDGIKDTNGHTRCVHCRTPYSNRIHEPGQSDGQDEHRRRAGESEAP